MPNPGDIFGITVAGQFSLSIAVGNYSKDPGDQTPFQPVLRIDGVGEFLVPDDAYSRALAQSDGLSDQEKIKVFLTEILSDGLGQA